MNQNCECTSVETTTLPVTGLSLNVETAALGGLSEADVQAMIDRSLATNPGGGIVPNLRMGVEVRYPALYEGKQVYAQLVNFGSMPNNASKLVPHNIPDIEWVIVSDEFSWVNGSGYQHPLSLGSTSAAWFYGISALNMRIQTFSDRRSCTAIFCILYTKTTDPVIG